MSVLEPQHALGQARERIQHPAKHDVKNAEDNDVEQEPDDRQGIKVLLRFRDLVGRLADDDDRIGVGPQGPL
jgi:hypothetical protein